MDSEIFDEKQNELDVKLPQSLIEFYTHFGNDEEVLTSYNDFGTAEDIAIVRGALVFGEKYQSVGLLGITLGELEKEHQVISWYPYHIREWAVESANDEVFFLGSASWQVLSAMPSIAKKEMSKEAFEMLIGKNLQYLSDKKLHRLGDVLTVIGEGVLGCYLVNAEVLYLGTREGDEVLERYKNCKIYIVNVIAQEDKIKNRDLIPVPKDKAYEEAIVKRAESNVLGKETLTIIF